MAAAQTAAAATHRRCCPAPGGLRPAARAPPVRLWSTCSWPSSGKCAEQDQLPALGLGITNVVARATARADELADQELREGGQALRAKAVRLRPRGKASAARGKASAARGKVRAARGG